MKKLVIALLIFTSCTASLETDTTIERDFSTLLGKRITVEGTAENTKHGAVVVTKSHVSIWIDELDSWPPEYYSDNDQQGRAVSVTGIITETNDIPLYIGRSTNAAVKKETLDVVATDPVTNGESRYVFKNASWQLIPQ